jgi:SAM-dependent methyltransferase
LPAGWLSRTMSGHEGGSGGGGHGHGLAGGGHDAHGRPSGHGHGHAHGSDGHDASHHAHGGGGRDRHGNPEDLEAYLARLEEPERTAWQKPDEVIAALGLGDGAVACDLGAGPGVFTLRLAGAVGPRGRVYAIDVEPRMLEILGRRAADAGISNVHPLLAEGGEVVVPPEPCDAILLVNTFHHFGEGPAALRRLATRLRPGGRLAAVDFHEWELPVGPPPEHKVSRGGFLAAASEAGLEVVEEKTFLPHQYFFVLRPR